MLTLYKMVVIFKIRRIFHAYFVNYHEHNYRYVQYNANLHTCVCIECGYQVNQNHKFVQSLNVPNKYCVFCGYQRFTIIGGDPIEVIL